MGDLFPPFFYISNQMLPRGNIFRNIRFFIKLDHEEQLRGLPKVGLISNSATLPNLAMTDS